MESRVSVVIPAYNAALYLADALASVRAQTVPPRETIVVDDGSTDGTGAIAEGSGVVVISRENGGPAVARNTGIQVSSGDLIAFLDADDMWEPRKLEVQQIYLDANPDASIVFCHHRYQLENEDRLPWHAFTEAAPGSRGSPLPSSWMVRRRVFDDVGLFDPDYRIGEDLNWLMRARDGGHEPRMIEQVLAVRRLHGENLTTDLAASQRAMFRVLRTRISNARTGLGNE